MPERVATAAPGDSPAEPPAALARRATAARRSLDALLDWWRPVSIALLWLLVPLVIAGRIEVLGVGAGGKSFTRNVVIFILLGALLGARDLRLQRSELTAPLLAFVAAVWLSVELNGGVRGEARLVTWMAGLVWAGEALAAGSGGESLLFHWLGVFALGEVAGELLVNPEMIAFDPAQRGDLRLLHANTLGGSLALVLPIFVAAGLSGRRAVAGWAYAAAAAFGIALSFSRSALVCGLLGCAVMLGVRERDSRFARGLRPLLLAGLAVGGIGAIWLSLSRSEADWQRLRILRTSFDLFLSQPVFGIGFGIENLRRLFPARYIELYGASLFLFHSHNQYLEFFVGTGIVGATAGFWLLYRIGALAGSGLRRSAAAVDRTRAAGFVGSFAVLLSLGLTDSLFYHAEILVVLPILWALMETSARRR